MLSQDRAGESVDGHLHHCPGQRPVDLPDGSGGHHPLPHHTLPHQRTRLCMWGREGGREAGREREGGRGGSIGNVKQGGFHGGSWGSCMCGVVYV